MSRVTLFAVAAVLGLGACQPTTPTNTTQQTAVMPVAVTAPAGSMMALLNKERTAQRRGVLTENARLTQAAQAHAQDMQTNGYFSHQGQNGSRFTQRAAAAGYGCAIAENIASGQQSEAEVMAVWMASSGHRRNILLSNAREYGVGRAGNVWVLMLGSGC